MSTVESVSFTKEEIYRMNNDTKYGFNWINLLHVNHVNPNNNNIKYKLYSTGREYIAFQEDKVLTYDEKRKYNIL